ncbi:hypothetical protein NDU88_005627 [Pleurodeles waltl]|uniref:Uncharacterized protein n=1 Tax=Pleurodeles waltl TaxID=8319 RepID=A0AAV7LLU0_PLEWA|nr:hypothetical protein NDU88_005627 [Pleurodeles waltl]
MFDVHLFLWKTYFEDGVEHNCISRNSIAFVTDLTLSRVPLHPPSQCLLHADLDGIQPEGSRELAKPIET